MYLSIIGSPGCGKTTLFRAFTGMAGAGSAGSSNVAIIDVPDNRLDKLSGIFHPKKTVYGRIEVCDMPSIHEGDMKSGTVPASQVQQLRSSDAFLIVLRLFDRDIPSDPASDFHTLASEFILSDMVQIENRLERIKKQGGQEGPDRTGTGEGRAGAVSCPPGARIVFEHPPTCRHGREEP